jgi:hypothetical protein
MKQYDILIGIDPGVSTGYSRYCPHAKKLLAVETKMIHEVLFELRELIKHLKIFVIVEDARLAVHGRSGAINQAKLQGAGSVKRDCSLIEDFLTDLKIPYRMTRPRKAITKMDSEAFKKLTGWQGRTSNHARDSALLIYGV